MPRPKAFHGVLTQSDDDVSRCVGDVSHIERIVSRSANRQGMQAGQERKRPSAGALGRSLNLADSQVHLPRPVVPKKRFVPHCPVSLCEICLLCGSSNHATAWKPDSLATCSSAQGL